MGRIIFQKRAVQDAMDTRSAEWGEGSGAYEVTRRISIEDSRTQTWEVRNTRPGPGMPTHEHVVFTKGPEGISFSHVTAAAK